MAKGKKALAAPKREPNAIDLHVEPGETQGEAMARLLLGPAMRNGSVAATYAGQVLGSNVEQPGIMDCTGYVKGQAEKAASGDLAMVSQMLTAQAIALDGMFTELARRSAMNMSEFLDASERYARLALKAQSNCRSTLEALAKLHQPREQTVKHVHIGRGGQAVVADEFHHHQLEGGGNERPAEQSHEPGFSASGSAALLGHHPEGNGVPLPSFEGQEAVPLARRSGGRSEGQ